MGKMGPQPLGHQRQEPPQGQPHTARPRVRARAARISRGGDEYRNDNDRDRRRACRRRVGYARRDDRLCGTLLRRRRNGHDQKGASDKRGGRKGQETLPRGGYLSQPLHLDVVLRHTRGDRRHTRRRRIDNGHTRTSGRVERQIRNIPPEREHAQQHVERLDEHRRDRDKRTMANNLQGQTSSVRGRLRKSTRRSVALRSSTPVGHQGHLHQ